MFGWLRRWLDGDTAPRSGAMSPHAAPGAVAPAPPPAFGLKRPLIGRRGDVAGFELLLPPASERRLAATAGASPAAAAHHIALLATAAPLLAQGKAALVQLPSTLLTRPSVAGAASAGVMLWVDALGAVPADVARALRARDVRLGVPDGPPQTEPPIDFVVLQASVGGIDTLLLSAQRWREVWPKLTVVALGLPHLNDIERALRGGIHLAGGHLSRSEPAAPARELGTAAHRICELLNHLALDRDTAVIAQAARADVALAYRLLRYANSAAIGMKRAVETVDEAVLVLGRGELYRWLTVQLMAAASARQAKRALQESSLARGRLLEAVARRRGDPDPGAHFTLGMLSLIEPLLQVSMASALAPLRLSEAASDALLRRQGPLAGRLALLEAIDDGQGAPADAQADALGVAEVLPLLIEEAWTWAAAVSDELEGAPGSKPRD